MMGVYPVAIVTYRKFLTHACCRMAGYAARMAGYAARMAGYAAR